MCWPELFFMNIITKYWYWMIWLYIFRHIFVVFKVKLVNRQSYDYKNIMTVAPLRVQQVVSLPCICYQGLILDIPYDPPNSSGISLRAQSGESPEHCHMYSSQKSVYFPLFPHNYENKYFLGVLPSHTQGTISTSGNIQSNKPGQNFFMLGWMVQYALVQKYQSTP